MSGPDQQMVTTALFEQWSVLEDLLENLEPPQWRVASALPGWDVHDIVAHIIGTESMLLGQAPPETDVDVRELEHVHNKIGGLNERWVLHLRGRSPDEMVQLFRDVTGRRRDAIGALSQAQWDEETMGPVGPTTYGGFMLVRHFDCWFHELDIRDAVQLPGDENGLRGELAMGVITGSMGFVVGKKAHAPEGSRVLFDLSGQLARQLRVEVAGRARLVDSFGEDATATLAMDSGLFVRLAGGRTRAADHWDEIALRGDEELGRRIAENLTFVI